VNERNNLSYLDFLYKFKKNRNFVFPNLFTTVAHFQVKDSYLLNNESFGYIYKTRSYIAYSADYKELEVQIIRIIYIIIIVKKIFD